MEILISGSGDFEGLEEIYSFLLSKTTSPVAQAFFFQIVQVPHLKPQRRLESSSWSGEPPGGLDQDPSVRCCFFKLTK